MKLHRSKDRIGFTLIELLVVISIIGLMSGMFLMAYRGAEQESSNQKTLSTIQKISEVLNSRMEEYASYSLVLRMPGGGILPPNAVPLPTNNPTETKTFLVERARLLCLREVIAMEMPDHPDDIKWSDKWVTAANSATFLDTVPKRVATGLTAGLVQNRTTSRVKGLAKKLSTLGPSGFVPIAGWQNANANAELLYLIIEDSQLNGSSAIELFGASEVADTDGDGLKEFVDGFGAPIQWIRWPTGFEGLARYHPDMLDPGIITGSGANIRVTIESDPLDRMGADPGYKTTNSKPGPGAFPLVVSSGLNRSFGIRFEIATPITVSGKSSYSVTDAVWASSTPSYFSSFGSFTDPWYPRATNAGKLGERLDNTAKDNITNYDGNGASL